MSEINGNVPELSALLNGILSNPGAIATLSSLIGSMGGERGKSDAIETCACEAPPRPPAPPPPPPKKKDPRLGLLEALRPFLSPERCEMMDSLIRILELLSLLQKKR